MLKPVIPSLPSRLLSSTIARFTRNQDGMAAIEFAFIAPVMLFMYFGMSEVATAISVDRRVSHSANVAGDLTTQSETVSAAEMTEIMTATMMVMGIPRDKQDGVTIEITSYVRNADDSVDSNGRALLKGSNGIDFPSFNPANLDEHILSKSSGVVVARVNYAYEPLKLRYMTTDVNLTEVFMLKPRKSINVAILDPSGSNNYSCDFSGGGAGLNNGLGDPNCTPSGSVP